MYFNESLLVPLYKRNYFLCYAKFLSDKGGFMKKSVFVLLITTMVFAGSAMLPQSGFAGVHVNVGINVPLPAFEFHAPPAVVVIPGTYVYAVPDADVDIVFYQGYWYRPHSDYWYRSSSYNGPWRSIDRQRVPGVLFKLPPDYRHMPPGHQRIPYGQLKKNWKGWEREKYWAKHDRHEEKEQRKEERHGQYREEKKEHKRGGRDRQDNY